MKNLLYLLAFCCLAFVVYLALAPKTTPTYALTLKAHQPNYYALARQDAIEAGIDPDIFARQINQESGFQPGAVSSTGAIGIAQFMPGTATGLGIDPRNPVQSLKAAAQLMASYYHQYGDYAKALAAYNAGPGAVAYAMQRGGQAWRAWLPRETQNYIVAILGNEA